MGEYTSWVRIAQVPCAIMLNLLGEAQPSDTYDKVQLARKVSCLTGQTPAPVFCLFFKSHLD